MGRKKKTDELTERLEERIKGLEDQIESYVRTQQQILQANAKIAKKLELSRESFLLLSLTLNKFIESTTSENKE